MRVGRVRSFDFAQDDITYTLNKKKIRQLIRQRKAEIPAEERQRLSETLCQKVLSTLHWQQAETILLYHALPDEVDTSLLLEEALKTGKTVLLPVVNGENLDLRLYTGETATGSFAIEEPIGPLFTAFEKIDLAIIPGMAFDGKGNRLGRGKGYYDRLLPSLSMAYKLGICFPFQLVESIPAEVHDIKMDAVIC